MRARIETFTGSRAGEDDRLLRIAKRRLHQLYGQSHGSVKEKEAWEHVRRFCEEAGCKSDILRATLPTEITDGGH